MKPMLIVKLGETMPVLAESHGDFENWLEARLHLGKSQLAMADPRVEPLPEPHHYAGVILTGSHSMVTDHEDWSERTARWISTVRAARVPLLGICYGHQLIAYASGGDVGPNPRGREFGTVDLELREAAPSDRLFAGLPARFRAHASHTQSVLRLPAEATWLASSQRDPHQAYRIGETTWGVQFHPEFPREAMHAYTERDADKLREAGDDPARILASITETPHAEMLLKRFAEIAT